MFKRVIYDNWTLIVPIVAFCFTILFYSAMVIRAALLRSDKADHMASLPLEDPSKDQ